MESTGPLAEQLNPLFSCVADAGLNVQAEPERLFTVTLVLTGEELPFVTTFTLTVPLVTIVPDQELPVPVPVTVFPVESLKLQLLKVLPFGALVTLHVVLLPRVTVEQDIVATLVGPLPWKVQVPGGPK